MNTLAYITLHLIAGWIGGKALASLNSARKKGIFLLRHWLILIASMIGAMLFARFIVANANNIKNLSDFVVGLSGVLMLGAIVLSSGVLFNKND